MNEVKKDIVAEIADSADIDEKHWSKAFRKDDKPSGLKKEGWRQLRDYINSGDSQ